MSFKDKNLTERMIKMSQGSRKLPIREFKRKFALQYLKLAHQSKKTNWYLKKKRGTSESFEKCIRAHVLPLNNWENSSKNPQITVVLSFDGLIAMTLDKQCKKSKWKVLNLVKLLPIEPENRGFVYELGCCDVSLEQSGDCLAILAVFWIEVATNNTPARCFGSIFRITKQLNVIFCKLIPSPSMVACCRLTDRKKFTGDQHCLLVFSKDAQVSAYRVEPNSIEQIDDVFDWFPSLALTNLPGGALRTSCKICELHRYSAVGLDTGYLIVSVCLIEENVILDSVRLRYASPISVVEFLPQVSNSVQRLLISSFMGPAGIWRLKFADDKLTWEHECNFERSQYFDSILCACIYRFYHGATPLVLFGTYSGRILQYELPAPTEHVRKSKKSVAARGRPINLLVNHCIYYIKQTGFNEISALTSFGFNVLRENLPGARRFGKRGAYFLNKYQNSVLIRKPKKKEDFTKSDLHRLSIDSATEMAMRPRVGSTVSQITYRYSDEDGIDRVERRRATIGAKDFQRATTQSASGSSNGSSSRLRQLDVAVADLYYQDGPSDPMSPNRTATLSPRIHDAHPQSPLATNDRSQPIVFRVAKKSLTSPRVNK